VQPRILIVDDEESILFAMREYFTTRGDRVDCACGLDEATVLLDTGPYSAVVADLRLSGTRWTERLVVVDRVRAWYPAAPVIILTAYGSLDVEREACRRGADAFRQKPRPLPEVARIVLELPGTDR
jgi:DNA-binding NtrC family response regulator